MLKTSTFSDIDEEEEKGNSRIIHFSVDSIISFVYELDSGYSFPYCGFRIQFSDGESYLNLSVFDSLEITVRAPHSNSVRIYILTNDTGFIYSGPVRPLRYLEKEIAIVDTFTTVSIPVAELSTHSWWYERYNVNKNYIQRHLDRTVALEIVNGLAIGTGIRDTIVVNDIRFKKASAPAAERKPIPAFMVMLIIGASGLIIVTVPFLINRTSRAQGSGVEFPYKKLDITNLKDNQQQHVIEYVLNNYNDPDMSVDRVAKATGTSSEKVSSSIKEYSNQSVKGFLNSIRIREACRLLRETDLTVSEVAFKVGYNNHTHFNRVFKEVHNLSPSQWREKETEQPS